MNEWEDLNLDKIARTIQSAFIEMGHAWWGNTSAPQLSDIRLMLDTLHNDLVEDSEFVEAGSGKIKVRRDPDFGWYVFVDVTQEYD